jgi:predicted patatin/cPLA2 family phospholipase
MEHKATVIVTTKAVYVEEPKWTTVMAKNVRQMVNYVVETLANVPKQKERKFNLRLTGFKAKEGETKKKLMQRLNIKLLQGQMRLCAKVVTAM